MQEKGKYFHAKVGYISAIIFPLKKSARIIWSISKALNKIDATSFNSCQESYRCNLDRQVSVNLKTHTWYSWAQHILSFCAQCCRLWPIFKINRSLLWYRLLSTSNGLTSTRSIQNWSITNQAMDSRKYQSRGCVNENKLFSCFTCSKMLWDPENLTKMFSTIKTELISPLEAKVYHNCSSPIFFL